MSTLVLIPAHNEEDMIGVILLEIRQLGIPILVVASACSDRTPDIAKEHGCFVIHSDIGYETACIQGYRWALQNGYSTVVQLDADGQHPSEYISVILNQATKADWIIASRQRTGTKISLAQRISSWTLKQTMNHLFRMSVQDPTSGMWVLHHKTLLCFCEKPSFVSMEAILRVYATEQGILIHEVPVPMMERFSGVSMHAGKKGMINWLRAMSVLVEYRFFLFKEEKRDYRRKMSIKI